MADKTACLPPIQNEPVFIDLMVITTLICDKNVLQMEALYALFELTK